MKNDIYIYNEFYAQAPRILRVLHIGKRIEKRRQLCSKITNDPAIIAPPE